MVALDISLLLILKFLVPDKTLDFATISRFHASAIYVKTFLHYIAWFAVKKKERKKKKRKEKQNIIAGRYIIFDSALRADFLDSVHLAFGKILPY